MKSAKTKTFIDAHVPNEAFWEGFIDHQHGLHQNPYAERIEAAEAWSTGQEAVQRRLGHGLLSSRGEIRMNNITDGGLISDFIRKHYRPFDAHREFERGFTAHQAGFAFNPPETDGDSAEIWLLGVEAAMRCERASA